MMMLAELLTQDALMGNFRFIDDSVRPFIKALPDVRHKRLEMATMWRDARRENRYVALLLYKRVRTARLMVEVMLREEQMQDALRAACSSDAGESGSPSTAPPDTH